MKKLLKSRPRIFSIFIRQTFCVVLPLSRMLTNLSYKLNKRLEFSILSVFMVGALLRVLRGRSKEGEQKGLLLPNAH